MNLWQNQDYIYKRQLASGQHSKVYLAEDIKNNKYVTIKATNCALIDDFKTIQMLRAEQFCLETLRQELDNPSMCRGLRFNRSSLRVAHLVSVFYEDSKDCKTNLESSIDGTLYFVFNFIKGAPLHKHILKQVISEEHVKFFAAELIRIIGALHERGFIYRDLKASNIILEPNGRLTLIDFGFAKYVGTRGRTRSMCGTLHAMSPEMFTAQENSDSFYSNNCNDLNNYSNEMSDVSSVGVKTTDEINNLSVEARSNLIKAKNFGFHSASTPDVFIERPFKYKITYGMEIDWWALGILIYEMLFGHPPFGYQDGDIAFNMKIQQLAINAPETVNFPSELKPSLILQNFIRNLLNADVFKRLGSKKDAIELQKAEWFQNFDWKQLENYYAQGPPVYQFSENEY